MTFSKVVDRAGLILAIGMLALTLFVAMASTLYAAPSVIGDVCATQCDRCVWDGTGFGPLVNNVVVNATYGSPTCGNRICARDVAGALVGTNNITLACRDSTSVWGDSVTVPFSFVRPPPPSPPGNMRVVPL